MPYKRDKKLVIQVRERDFNMCQCCYRYNEALPVHHIIPLFMGGEDVAENMIALCDACHDMVNENDWTKFINYQRMGGAINALSIATLVFDCGTQYDNETIATLRNSSRAILLERFWKSFQEHAKYMMAKYGEDYFDDY